MESTEAIKEQEKLQRERERLMRKAAEEVLSRRPKDSTLGGNQNPCKLTIPKSKRKKP